MSDFVAETPVNVNGNGIVDATAQPSVVAESTSLKETHQVEVDEVADEEDVKDTAANDDDEAPAPIKKKVPLDITSNEAFPSLGPAKPAPPIKVPAWSKQPTNANGLGLIGGARNVVSSRAGSKPQASSTRLELASKDKTPDNQLSNTIGAIVAGIKKSTGARIEHHKDQANNSTFLITGSASEILRARNELLKEIALKVCTASCPSIGRLLTQTRFPASSMFPFPSGPTSLASRDRLSRPLRRRLASRSRFPTRMRLLPPPRRTRRPSSRLPSPVSSPELTKLLVTLRRLCPTRYATGISGKYFCPY